MLQGDTLALYLFIICLDYVLRTTFDIIKDDGFKLAKERSRGYPAQTITNADYADDIVLLANTLAQAETLLDSLEWAAAEIYWTSPGGNNPQNCSYKATYHPSWKLSKLNEPDMWDTVGEVRMNS